MTAMGTLMPTEPKGPGVRTPVRARVTNRISTRFLQLRNLKPHAAQTKVVCIIHTVLFILSVGYIPICAGGRAVLSACTWLTHGERLLRVMPQITILSHMLLCLPSLLRNLMISEPHRNLPGP